MSHTQADTSSAAAIPVIADDYVDIEFGTGALKIGADADFRAPMAIAVIGGLITSTVLSLFYIPVVFTYVDDAKRWVGRMVRRSAHPANAAGATAG